MARIPYLAIDPVLVAAHIITAAQSLVSRNVSPIDNAVVSLCSMHAGEPDGLQRDPARGAPGRHRAHLPAARCRT